VLVVEVGLTSGLRRHVVCQAHYPDGDSAPPHYATAQPLQHRMSHVCVIGRDTRQDSCSYSTFDCVMCDELKVLR
jgi:hypothetical protein